MADTVVFADDGAVWAWNESMAPPGSWSETPLRRRRRRQGRHHHDRGRHRRISIEELTEAGATTVYNSLVELRENLDQTPLNRPAALFTVAGPAIALYSLWRDGLRRACRPRQPEPSAGSSSLTMS